MKKAAQDKEAEEQTGGGICRDTEPKGQLIENKPFRMQSAGRTTEKQTGYKARAQGA